MSTPPTWPVPEPESPNPFAPPPESAQDSNAGPQSPYGPGYAVPTPPPWQTPPTGPPEQPAQSPYGAPGSGYPQAPPPGYGYPQGPPPYGYAQGPTPGYGYPPPVWAPPQAPMDGLAIASIVTSGAGIVLAGVTGPVGIGLGIASLRRIRRTGARGRGLAWAGIAIGIAMTLFVAGLIVLAFGLTAFSDHVDNTSVTTARDAQGNAQDAGDHLAFDEVLFAGDCLDAIPAPDLSDPSFVDWAAGARSGSALDGTLWVTSPQEQS
jgi:hypothetical protein